MSVPSFFNRNKHDKKTTGYGRTLDIDALPWFHLPGVGSDAVKLAMPLSTKQNAASHIIHTFGAVVLTLNATAWALGLLTVNVREACFANGPKNQPCHGRYQPHIGDV